jgi:hypothetical protein
MVLLSFIGVRHNCERTCWNVCIPYNVTCGIVCWLVTSGITISLACNSTIVLQQAYLASCRQRWVIIVGTTLILSQFGFLYVAYKQYHLFGSGAWRRLARDGVQTMCLVIVCNVACGLFLFLKLEATCLKCLFLLAGKQYATQHS